MDKENLTLISMILVTLVSLEGAAFGYRLGSPYIAVLSSFGAVVFNHFARQTIIKKLE